MFLGNIGTKPSTTDLATASCGNDSLSQSSNLRSDIRGCGETYNLATPQHFLYIDRKDELPYTPRTY